MSTATLYQTSIDIPTAVATLTIGLWEFIPMIDDVPNSTCTLLIKLSSLTEDSYSDCRAIFGSYDWSNAQAGSVFYWDDVGAVRPQPVQPTSDHVWNWSEYMWVQGLSESERFALEASKVRLKRTELLSATDWTQVRDVPEATAALWSPYRQALRAITQQVGFPFTVEWPTTPAL